MAFALVLLLLAGAVAGLLAVWAPVLGFGLLAVSVLGRPLFFDLTGS